MRKLMICLTALLFLSLLTAKANKTSVEIKAPAEVKAGTEFTITLNVFHNGNSKGHHTDWVVLKINGKEIKRWSYDKSSLPPNGNFTVEYKYVAEGSMEIVAAGHCNLHGSAGPKTINIKSN